MRFPRGPGDCDPDRSRSGGGLNAYTPLVIVGFLQLGGHRDAVRHPRGSVGARSCWCWWPSGSWWTRFRPWTRSTACNRLWCARPPMRSVRCEHFAGYQHPAFGLTDRRTAHRRHGSWDEGCAAARPQCRLGGSGGSGGEHLRGGRFHGAVVRCGPRTVPGPDCAGRLRMAGDPPVGSAATGTGTTPPRRVGRDCRAARRRRWSRKRWCSRLRRPRRCCRSPPPQPHRRCSNTPSSRCSRPSSRS